jgi:sodium/bile acid cotransporter 7
MGIVLTKLVGGDEAAAIFDAAFGNFLGVFLSPALILMYLGLNAEVNLGQVTMKLFLRVVLPLFVGQLLRNFFPPAKAFAKKYNKYFRQGQEFCLVFVVYTIFCKTFLKGNDAKIGDVFIMIGCVLLVLVFIMGLAWLSMLVLFPKDPKLQAVGLFACTHKTVAVGVPLISSIYSDSPTLGLYVLPLLIWYPTQLVLGTALAPYLAKYIERREEELKQQHDVDAWLLGRGDISHFPPYHPQEQQMVLNDADEGIMEPKESQIIGTV